MYCGDTQEYSYIPGNTFVGIRNHYQPSSKYIRFNLVELMLKVKVYMYRVYSNKTQAKNNYESRLRCIRVIQIAKY